MQFPASLVQLAEKPLLHIRKFFECRFMHFMHFPAFLVQVAQKPPLPHQTEEDRCSRGKVCLPMKSSTINERPLVGYGNPLVHYFTKLRPHHDSRCKWPSSIKPVSYCMMSPDAPCILLKCTDFDLLCPLYVGP